MTGRKELGREGLELHRVGACFGGDVDQLMREVEITVVINSDLSNHKRGETQANLVPADLDRS